MSKEAIIKKLQEAMIATDEEVVDSLVSEALEAKLSPTEIITEGLSSGLTIIGDRYAAAEMFLQDLMIAGEIMTVATEKLRPLMEAGGKPLGETMILGTVEGDVHTIGKAIVGAMFTGAGYRVIDIGVNAPATAFVEAAKEHKATIVGAAAILSPVKAYCEVINRALIDARIRDDVIYIVGGWGMSQEWSDKVGADAFGENAVEGVNKVKMIKAGELPKIKERRRT